jgi:hypothetical protein
VLVNLTAQGAVNTLGALRKAGCGARLMHRRWEACRGSRWSSRSSRRSNRHDPAQARRLRLRGARILTVGGDVGALGACGRRWLARATVSMAWTPTGHRGHASGATRRRRWIDLPKGDGYAIVVTPRICSIRRLSGCSSGTREQWRRLHRALEATGDKTKQVSVDACSMRSPRAPSPPTTTRNAASRRGSGGLGPPITEIDC